MGDIFICYSKSDRAIATRLGRRLGEEGWSVFMDVQTHVGHRWHKEIEKELHGARAVVVLWSARSRDSDFVLEEAEYGRRKAILFPAFIEQVEFPYGFGRIHTADLLGWAGDDEGHPGLAQLLESLKEHLNGGETTAGPGNVPQPDAIVTSKSVQATPVGPTNHVDRPGRDVVTSKPVQGTPARVPALAQTFRDRLKTDAEGPLMVDGNYTYNGSAKAEYRKQTVPVGSFPPNAFGLYDMHGNVWEWCQDQWHGSYEGAPSDGSAWEGGEKLSRVLRGGAWDFRPRHCRAANRGSHPPEYCNDSVGFRVCCAAPIETLDAGPWITG